MEAVLIDGPRHGAIVTVPNGTNDYRVAKPHVNLRHSMLWEEDPDIVIPTPTGSYIRTTPLRRINRWVFEWGGWDNE